MTQTSYYRHHVFFCLNQRSNGEACCMQQGAQQAFDHCKARVKALGLAGPGGVRVNKAGCLDRCEEGPVTVCYPEGRWFRLTSEEEVRRFVLEYLAGGRAPEGLEIAADPA